MPAASGYRLEVGDVTITALSDGRMSIPSRRLFPDTDESVWDAFRERFPEAFDAKGFYTNIGVFHLATSGRQVLVDTGLGPDGEAGGRYGPPELLDDMRAKGVAPNEIDNVFLTHLHNDHIGWNLTPEGDEYRPTFPNAKYLLQEADWRHFTEPDFLGDARRSTAERTYLPLREMGVLELIAGDRPIAPGLTALHTPGHTPGHMSLLISSGRERAIILGDVAGSPMQITEPDQFYRPDVDQSQARATRHRLLDMAERDGMTVMGSHLTRPGWGVLVRWQGRRYWQAL